jgi:glycosyltransferase involved in cell wall biosynthesis
MLDFKFSVLLPVYYKEDPNYFRLALESLKNQTLPPSEVVLVKDGSLTLDLEKVIEEYEPLLPFKVLPLDQSNGLGDALHHGLLNCSHEYVARMDSDDICVKERFEKQAMIFMSNPNLDILGSYLKEFVNEVGDLNDIRRVPLRHNEIYSYTFRRCPFNHPTVMFKKSAVLKAGSYKRMPFFEDYYLWIRMAVAGCQFQNTDEILLNYRIGNNMINRRHGLKYAKHELEFFRTCSNQGLITNSQLLRFSARFPIRLMPLVMLKRFYQLVLRK